MDGSVFRLIVPLFVCGLLTTTIASIVVSMAAYSKTIQIVSAFLTFGWIPALIAYGCLGDRDLKKIMVIAFVCFLDFAGGVAASLANEDFYVYGSYIDRVTVHLVTLAAWTCSMTCSWPHLTRIFAENVLANSEMDMHRERSFYVFWGLIMAFIDSFAIAGASSYVREELAKTAMLYSIAVDIIGGILAAGVGLMFLVRCGCERQDSDSMMSFTQGKGSWTNK